MLFPGRASLCFAFLPTRLSRRRFPSPQDFARAGNSLALSFDRNRFVRAHPLSGNFGVRKRMDLRRLPGFERELIRRTHLPPRPGLFFPPLPACVPPPPFLAAL